MEDLFYETFKPCPALEAFIKCYWTLDSPPGEKKNNTFPTQTIVPDECMEMIFHYGEKYRQFLELDTSIIQPRHFVFGQLTRPLQIAPTGRTGIFAVRFHPEGFYPFASFPIRDMENQAVPLGKLFGPKGAHLGREVKNATSTPERILIVEKFLTDLLNQDATVDRIISNTVNVILEVKGQYSVGKLADSTQIHRRQLERKISSATGLSPKQLSRIIRLQSVLKKLISGEFASLSSLAYEGEYFDQAHFIRDFKDFTGQTPREFYGENLKFSKLFYSE